jgi:type VI secretion system secreted protein VgrG
MAYTAAVPGLQGAGSGGGRGVCSGLHQDMRLTERCRTAIRLVAEFCPPTARQSHIFIACLHQVSTRIRILERSDFRSAQQGTIMADVTQNDRLITIETPLGKDKLLVKSISGSEGVSQLFHFQLELLSVDASIQADAIVGKSVTIGLQLSDGKYRYFNGLVNRFGQGEKDNRFSHYQAQVIPWFWLLTRTADCRIFQKKTVPDIITKIFGEYGFKDFRFVLSGKYTEWDYCVQYRETDFNFISRLMETEGIFYFFEHSDKKHVLVLADEPGKFQTCAQAKARYLPEGGYAEREDTMSSWVMTREMRPGAYTYRDYHFQKPDTYFQVNKPTTCAIGGNSKYEIYDYPGEYALRFNEPEKRLDKINPEGEKLVKLRMEEEDVQHRTFHGASFCRAFDAGYQFELTNHAALNGKYAIIGLQFNAVQSPDYYSQSTTGHAYHNHITCIPAQLQFRPPRLTPKPIVQGLQSAVVVGAKGKEIDVDKFGRIKVQFPWDREGKKDENSSCWLRVAQFWAGKRWGASHWPRIGQEVLVSFLEGDPDHPIVVGSVYNEEQMPPYLGDGLDPKHKHDPNLSGIKSNSTLGGKGFNEFRFDDTSGKEQIFIHAQHNMDQRILHDSMERVINNRHLIVGWEKTDDSLLGEAEQAADVGGTQKGGDQRELVYQDKHLHIMRHQVEQIEGNHQFLVGKGDADDGGNMDVSVEKDKKETIGGNSNIHVTKDRKEKVDQNESITIGKDRSEKVGGNQSLQVASNQAEKVGQNHSLDAGQQIYLKAGQTLILEAGSQLSLKVGGNFINIDSSGVSIKGSQVMINSGGAAGSGSAGSPKDPDAPDDAKDANPTKPTQADDSKSGSKSAPG